MNPLRRFDPRELRSILWEELYGEQPLGVYAQKRTAAIKRAKESGRPATFTLSHESATGTVEIKWSVDPGAIDELPQPVGLKVVSGPNRLRRGAAGMKLDLGRWRLIATGIWLLPIWLLLSHTAALGITIFNGVICALIAVWVWWLVPVLAKGCSAYSGEFPADIEVIYAVALIVWGSRGTLGPESSLSKELRADLKAAATPLPALLVPALIDGRRVTDGDRILDVAWALSLRVNRETSQPSAPRAVEPPQPPAPAGGYREPSSDELEAAEGLKEVHERLTQNEELAWSADDDDVADDDER